MNLLVIDAGNSRCKLCSGDTTQGFPADSYESIATGEIHDRLTQIKDLDACWISSVNHDATIRIQKALGSRLGSQSPVFLNSDNSPIPVVCDQPETLGTDRLAAAIGAYQKCQGRVIVVDSGTATTIDLVDENGSFLGGNILPGIGLQLKSLTNTDQLPQVAINFDQPPGYLGKETNGAIRSGVFWGHVGAVEKIVANLKAEHGPAAVYVTGGYGRSLLNASQLPDAVFSNTLVLEGLWESALQTK